ncbi:7,8-dihydroneopterin aldolase [Thiomicrorhabdus immobilis]|uniref:7,8-dihydroneopterin aldolase n=1 Tax=Thiomicrorhabdus immobilis TaxID=2791037 RepID=A0ABN6CYQ9_9GAMM|nr:dihydroneopterin aldolase [Thiomicrorhabdus immobilis]BCN94083.1 7,8-dihydroneopterin aldolase [Thiomicrorhabdus immobilis]
MSHTPSTQPMDTVFIEGLKTQAIIGIYDWERENRQPLIFDIDMDLPIAQAAKSDDINDTVDYKQVSDEVIAIVEQSRHELLETLCEEICQHILKNHLAVQMVRLKVSKPQAVAETDTVGLKITRHRVL